MADSDGTNPGRPPQRADAAGAPHLIKFWRSPVFRAKFPSNGLGPAVVPDFRSGIEPVRPGDLPALPALRALNPSHLGRGGGP
jgi:hypothetical protein